MCICVCAWGLQQSVVTDTHSEQYVWGKLSDCDADPGLRWKWSWPSQSGAQLRSSFQLKLLLLNSAVHDCSIRRVHHRMGCGAASEVPVRVFC